MVTLYATTELVAVAWISGIPGLTASGVGTQLPADETTWSEGGYIVVPTTVGGAPHDSMPMQRPVIQCECWATVPNSDALPWLMAVNLAEQVRLATYDRSGAFGRPLDIGDGYPTAWVRSATILTQPRRVFSDIGDYAGYTFDLLLQFVAAGEVIA